MHHMHAWRLLVVSGAEGTHRCELPYGCWDLNLGPLEEQQVGLTDEPSLQHPKEHPKSVSFLGLP